jgi:outer membrane protein assembly factor BamB
LGGRDNRTGAVVALDPKSFNEQWRVQAPGELRIVRTGRSLHALDDPPLVVRDSVLVGVRAPDGAGSLRLVSLDDGDVAWEAATGEGNGVPTAAGDDDRIVYRLGSPFGGPGTVVAVETKSGKQRWETATDTIQDPVVIDDAAVHVTTDGNTIVSDLGDGDQRWRALARSYLAAVEDRFVLLDRGGDLVGVQAEDGSEEWRSPTDGGGCSVGARVVEETLLYVSRPCPDADGAARDDGDPTLTLHVVDVGEDGSVTGTVELPGDLVDQLDVVDGLAAIASVANDADRTLTVVDVEAAETKWDTPLPNGRLAALDGDHVYYVDDDGRLVAADRDDGEEDWADDQDAALVAPVVADGTVYGAFGAGDRVVLRALAASDGDDRWEEPPRLRESGEVTVAGDVLYVADADTVYRIE